MNIQIISDQKDYLIINKPAGLIAHGGKGIKEKTLSDWLIENYPEIAKVGDDPERPGIVHRLDKEASGLMLIPKNNEAFEFFKNQFKNRKIKKEYLALVYGKIEKEYGVIDFPIKRSSQGFKMAAIPSPKNENELELLRSGRGEYANYLEEYNKINQEGETKNEEEAEINKENKTEKETEGAQGDVGEKTEEKKMNNRARGGLKALEKSRQAITEFKVVKKFINFTLVRAIIKTGRTHQIRVHFFAYGHPLLGDNLYSNKKSKIKNQKIKPGRIFLIADTLGFKDLNGDWQEFKIEMDENLEGILDRIK
ncbi:RNA pseudouridine synthase [Patescibacteria group bacterium]|nr:RNA pseudouridine synthase [Patescibacteria group bacterium]